MSGRKPSRRELLVLGGFLAAGAGGAWAVRRMRPPGTLAGWTPVVRAAHAEPAPVGGNPDGDLSLLLFTDFNCAACRLAHGPMMAAIAADGGVKLKYMDWPIFGADSRAAALVAQAADAQGLTPAVHAAMMQGPRASGPGAEAAVAEAGGDVAALRTALADEAPALMARLSRYAFHAFSLGLAGTPGHLIGPLLLPGAHDERGFRRAFDRARAEPPPG
jgi:protein-disulfide isomerase